MEKLKMSFMKTISLLFCLSAINLQAESGIQIPRDNAYVTGTISATALNIRVKPNKSYGRICLLKFGTKVKVYRKVADWYEIAAPQNAACWVAKTFIDMDGKVLRDVNLRGGPGPAYQSYCTVPKGTMLTITNNARSEWAKIKPLPTLRAWASAKFISMTPSEQKKLQYIMNPAQVMAAVSNPVTQPANRPAPQLKLAFVAGSEKPVTLEGMVLELKSGSGYATHALAAVKTDARGKVISCNILGYLHCDSADLKMFENKRIKLAGEQRLVKGWKLPVIHVHKILYVK
jgi:uncharacterized protein YgiM (DUF1202 family)